MSAGIILLGGRKGLLLAGMILSILNLVAHPNQQFWQWEFILIVGLSIGSLALEIINRKAQDQVFSGLVGGFISLVVFGVFATPLLAIIVWVLIVGTGLVPKTKNLKGIWELMPTVWRVVMGLAGIVYGNLLYPL